MGRPQTFNANNAARTARDVFWTHGYEGASLQELEDATGLNKSSIYNTFGSKKGLFDAAVQNYLDEVVRPALAPLIAQPATPDAIVDYLNRLRHALTANPERGLRDGCLLVNSAGAPIARDKVVSGAISSYRAELHDAVAAGIRARHPAWAHDKVARASDVVTALIVSAMTMVRVDVPAAGRACDVALEVVEA